MKKLSLTISFILISISCVFAQGNLQFNQVLTFGGNLSASGCNWSTIYDTSQSWIVPQNKVWKIEHKTRVIEGGLLQFLINNTLMFDLFEKTVQPVPGAIGYAMTVDNAPIWLKSGDAIKFQASMNVGNACNSFSKPYFISIIEYNIVP